MTSVHEDDPPTDIHGYMGLSYANYLVLPRTLLQSMPETWQHRFTALLRVLDNAFAGIPLADGYDVRAGAWIYVNECTPDMLKAARVSCSDDDPDHPEDADTTWHDDATGQELQGWHYVFVPGEDPVPDYSRGRARIEPNIPASANPAAGTP